jgi:prophage regulatory protein
MTDQRHDPSTFILAQEMTGLVPFSPNHLRRLEAQGDFPRRIRIGANRIAWLRDEVEQWLADRVEAR